MLSIGQELYMPDGPANGNSAKHCSCPSRSVNAPNRSWCPPEKNDTTGVPASTVLRRIRKHSRLPSSHVNALQLSVGEEPDRLTVRRPERILGALSTGDRLGIGAIERAEPESWASVVGRDERNTSPIRGQRKLQRRTTRRSGDVQPHLG